MARQPLEIVKSSTTSEEVVQRDLRTQTQLSVGQLDIIQPGNVIRESKVSDNSVLLNTGSYPRSMLSRSGTIVTGQPGSQIRGLDLSASGSRFSNVWFTDTVLLAPASRVVFDGCRFDYGVSMASGSKASFVSCVFANNTFVNNSGVAADAGIIGCVRGTNPHVNATILFEVS